MIKFLSLFLLSTTFAFALPTIVLTEDNSIVFNQPVKGGYIAKKQVEIFEKHAKLSFNRPLYLVLDTPGGSVIDGMLFLDSLKSLKRPIHTITIFAASMGYQFVQNLDTRYILPSGTLMSHRGAIGGLSGQVPGELNSRLAYFEYVLNQMNVTASKRTKIPLKQYEASIINELWVSGHDAVAKRHADFVVNVICDKSLSGTYKQEFMSLFGPIEVNFSKCPLISQPVSVDLGNRFTLEQRRTILKEVEDVRRKVKLTYE
jgi:ATP-dependent protease ClpP protease subunit